MKFTVGSAELNRQFETVCQSNLNSSNTRRTYSETDSNRILRVPTHIP